VVYRYMEAKYVDLFLEKGIIRISSFNRFRKYPDEVRGDNDEGGGAYQTYSKEGTQNTIYTNTGSDSYLLCGSLINDKTIQGKFEVDSGIKIKDTVGFSNAILNAIPGTTESFLGF